MKCLANIYLILNGEIYASVELAALQQRTGSGPEPHSQCKSRCIVQHCAGTEKKNTAGFFLFTMPSVCRLIAGTVKLLEIRRMRAIAAERHTKEAVVGSEEGPARCLMS